MTDDMAGEVDGLLELLDVRCSDDVAICCLITAGSPESRTRTRWSGSDTPWTLIPMEYVGSPESERPVLFAH